MFVRPFFLPRLLLGGVFVTVVFVFDVIRTRGGGGPASLDEEEFQERREETPMPSSLRLQETGNIYRVSAARG